MRPERYSSDGRWWWDGRAWWPAVYQANTGPPGLFWFFQAPGWTGPFFLMGLLLLLPIVGQMVALGWYLAARDNLRHGWRVLPRASFDHLERGARLWVVGVLYGLYALPLFLLLAAALVVAIVAGSAAAIALLACLLALSWLAVSVTTGFLAAAIYDLADAGGIACAAHPGRVWSAARADARNSWRVYGAFFLGGLVTFGLFIVTLPVLIFIPFGVVLVAFAVPGVYLMAAPAQADFAGATNVGRGGRMEPAAPPGRTPTRAA